MADVEIMQTVSETKKTKKVKKTTKRRESEVQITEVEQTDQNEEKGYVSCRLVLWHKCICQRNCRMRVKPFLEDLEFFCCSEVVLFYNLIGDTATICSIYAILSS
uniref:Uncharacterized protein n=1 Tax=Bactrocera latifrons TaxID=174628 RepID=A0A0K8UYM1_BACLA